MRSDDERDLTWYFGGEAEAELGARSVQGGFEATMHRLALCGPARGGRPAVVDGVAVWQEGDVPVRETRSGPPDGEATERQLAAAERAHRIRQRLDRLARRDRAVLEVSFGDREQVAGVGVALLCQTSAVRAATALVNARRSRRGRPALAPREAVLVLAGSTTAEDTSTLAGLVLEARTALDGAVKAYGEARHAG